MSKIKNFLRTLFTAGAITTTACSIPDIADNIESILNSAQEHISEFQQSDEYKRYLAQQWVERQVIERVNFVREQFNNYNSSYASFQNNMEDFVVSSAEAFWDLTHPEFDLIPDPIEQKVENIINPIFGFNSSTIISSSETRTTADFDSFADIDSSIVVDFQERYNSPLDIQGFVVDTLEHQLSYLTYGEHNYIPSTKIALNENVGNCSATAISLIPVALEDDNYPSIILRMYNKEEQISIANLDLIHYTPGAGHTVFLYHPDLIGDTPQHNFYNNESTLGLEIFSEISFRDFIHNQPGWYTAGVNASDFNGPYNSVEQIVEHYGYCNRVILNLNDYDVDFKYSNEDLLESIPGYLEREPRADLQDDWQIDLTDRVKIFIDNPFIPDPEDNTMYAEDREYPYLSLLGHYIPLLSQNSESTR
jgi:hypothetical protein